MSKTLVAYFSASGVTGSVARTLSDALSADLYEITPAVRYTDEDLDWRNANSRSSVEMKDKSSRPEIANTPVNIADYDTILLGFPIWWYVAPTIVNTFLEKHDFSGRKIILFATSGGSDFGKTIDSLKDSVPGAIIEEGMLQRGKQDLEAWKSWAKSLCAKEFSMSNDKVFAMPFAKVFPLLIAKAERKGRSREEVYEVTAWLTGYTAEQLDALLESNTDYGAFLRGMPCPNKNCVNITGSVCGVKLAEIDDPLMLELRRLDKLVDELAKGKPMEKILRK